MSKYELPLKSNQLWELWVCSVLCILRLWCFLLLRWQCSQPWPLIWWQQMQKQHRQRTKPHLIEMACLGTLFSALSLVDMPSRSDKNKSTCVPATYATVSIITRSCTCLPKKSGPVGGNCAANFVARQYRGGLTLVLTPKPPLPPQPHRGWQSLSSFLTHLSHTMGFLQIQHCVGKNCIYFICQHFRTSTGLIYPLGQKFALVCAHLIMAVQWLHQSTNSTTLSSQERVQMSHFLMWGW